MARSDADKPTELELEILKVLWQEFPLLVREVRARLKEQSGRVLAHSTVITMLNIMVGKRYVRRKKHGKAYLFYPVLERDEVSGGFVRDVVNRLFDGSPAALVLNLLESTDVDDDELREMRKMINRKAKEQ